jgi:hypothetical protein
MNGQLIFAQYEQAQRLFSGEGTQWDLDEYKTIVADIKLGEYEREMAERAISNLEV